jgi:hypothetical protein
VNDASPTFTAQESNATALKRVLSSLCQYAARFVARPDGAANANNAHAFSLHEEKQAICANLKRGAHLEAGPPSQAIPRTQPVGFVSDAKLSRSRPTRAKASDKSA